LKGYEYSCFTIIDLYDLRGKKLYISIFVSGNIRNTQKVYYKDRHNFILKIVARDCGGRQSKAVFINVLVKEKCKPQWTGKQQKF
jgi:hypothetical protein